MPALPAFGALLLAAMLVALAFREWRARPDPAPDPAISGIQALEAIAADLPERDPVALAARFGRIDPEAVEAARTLDAPRPAASVGDTERFFVHDIVNQRYLEVDAELELMTDVAAFWVQLGHPFDAEALQAGAERFSEDVYPTLRAAFGTEWSPGVDHDPLIHILHHEPVPGIAGFFSSSDEMSPRVDPYSNAREMFYINLSVFRPGTDDYLALLAHEFQHMIHWNHDRGEPTWVNEGLSELAPHLVGYGAQHGGAYLTDPDVQLTGWKPTTHANAAHYAAAYLFVAYLHDRYGDGILRAIVAAPGNGGNGIEQAVSAVVGDADSAPSFEELFLDWTVANALGQSRAPETESAAPWAAWFYRRDVPRVVQPRPLDERGARDTVSQFGADYWDVTHLARDGRLVLRFEGASNVGLLDELASDPALAIEARGGREGEGEGEGAYPGPESDGAAPAVASAYPGFDSQRSDRSLAAEVAYPGLEAGVDDGVDGAGGDDDGEDAAAGAGAGSETIWWSGQADGMHSRLERAIDLTGASGGHLDLRLWYELEDNWDYAYYTASVDGGRTWRTLSSSLTTEDNPNGNNLGAGLTGASGGWVSDRIDLDGLAGSALLLSIDVITDDAVSLAGVAIDDVRVVIDGEAESGDEAGPSGWTPIGWIAVDPRLPQLWGLQLIVDRGRLDPPSDAGDAIRVLRFDAGADGSAWIEADDVPPDATLTLVISGMTPATRSVARYQLSASEAVRSPSEPSPSP